MTEDELALARMDDDGFGCAIMTEPKRRDWTVTVLLFGVPGDTADDALNAVSAHLAPLHPRMLHAQAV
jgi:hypothetical protein